MSRILNYCTIIAVFLSVGSWQTPAQATSPAGRKAQEQSIVNLDATQSAKLLSTNQQVIVLDVRTPEEFAGGHVPGATNLNFNSDEFQSEVAKLDRNEAYLVHCASGRRSAKTREMMKDLQFKSVYHMDGGFNAWKRKGNKVEK